MAKSKFTKKEKEAIGKALSNKKVVVIIISILLVIALGFGVFYFAFNDEFNKLFGIESEPTITNPEGHLTVHFLDVGQGDSIIIQLPDGKNMIIDAGGDSKNNHTVGDDKVGADDVIIDKINHLGITEFEYMLLTHTDADHVDYLDTVLSEYVVHNIYRPAFRSKSEVETSENSKYAIVDTITYDNFITSVYAEQASGAKVHYNIGDFDITGIGYNIDMQCVDEKEYLTEEIGTVSGYEKNFVSPFTVLRYGKIEERIIVFTGDAEGKDGSNGNGAEGYYLDKYDPQYDADVLKAGHHGSATSSSQEFLDAIDPEYVIISAGVNNTHAHPRVETLDRLADYTDDNGEGLTTYSTRDHGDISLSISPDGVMEWTTRFPKTLPVTPGPAHKSNMQTSFITTIIADKFGICA